MFKKLLWRDTKCSQLTKAFHDDGLPEYEVFIYKPIYYDWFKYLPFKRRKLNFEFKLIYIGVCPPPNEDITLAKRLLKSMVEQSKTIITDDSGFLFDSTKISKWNF